MRSETRLQPARAPRAAGAELRVVANRFRAGDFHGALSAAMHALDETPVPILRATPQYLARAELSNVERIIVALIDGTTQLEEVIEASGFGLLEGIEAIAALADRGIVAFDPASADEPKTLRPLRRA